MSRAWLLSTLIAAACFVEAPTVGGCPRGEPGCDCDEGMCVESSECVASIDKCVPADCTPGMHTCICTPSSECEGNLLCREGVCVNEEMATVTGESQASSASGSASEDSSSGATAATTDVSDSNPVTTNPTSTSDDAGSGETGSGSATGSTTTSGGPMTCEQCVLAFWDDDVCAPEMGSCAGKAACEDIYVCWNVGASFCCGEDTSVWEGWDAYVTCALGACALDPAECDAFFCSA